MVESIGSTFSTSSGFEMANFNLQILLNVQLCVAGFRLKLEHFSQILGEFRNKILFFNYPSIYTRRAKNT